MAAKSAISTRRTVAKESFKTAKECIGDVSKGMSLFAVTRGQFSMLDAVLHVLDQVGRAKISLWTWTIAEYEIERFRELQRDGRLYDSTLIIDGAARKKNADLIAEWKRAFGENSVRYVLNHAKIARIENDEYKFLLRGSMNLNFNPRFEQFDITEGGLDYDLVEEIESELEILADNAGGDKVYKNTKVGDAFNQDQLDIFKECKVWAK